MNDCFTQALQQGHNASKLGFDWSNAQQVLQKVREEVDELEEAIATENPSEIHHELGDICLALTSVARHLNLSLEDVLMSAMQRFDTRWDAMMNTVHNKNISPETLSPTDWEHLWKQAKMQVDKS